MTALAPPTGATTAGPPPAASAGPRALVALQLGGRELAVDLDRVVEVVRLGVLTPLDGAHPALAGVLDVRGRPLPVYDVRPGRPATGSVVVLAPTADEEPLGVAVDAVLGVVDAAAMPVGRGAGDLPPYVLDVRTGSRGMVFRVDLRALAVERPAG